MTLVSREEFSRRHAVGPQRRAVDRPKRQSTRIGGCPFSEQRGASLFLGEEPVPIERIAPPVACELHLDEFAASVASKGDDVHKSAGFRIVRFHVYPLD